MLKRNIYQFACWVAALTLVVACSDVEEAFQELAPKVEKVPELAPEKESEKVDASEETRAYSYENEVTLTVETPGTLEELLGDSLTTVDKLVLNGKLNGNDVTVFTYKTTALLSLDLTNVELVQDGTKYLSS